MKKIILVAFMLLLPAIAFAQPSIVFDMEQHDFGTIEKAGVLEFSFDFRNEGAEDLEINKVIPSWGCTAVMASSSRLKPGEKGKINTKFETAGRKGFVSKGITVHSNDPKRPVINLTLKVNIQ